MEIEKPSPSQKAAVDKDEIKKLAEAGATEVEIVSRLMAKGISAEKAKGMIPGILKESRGKRLRGKLIRLILGGALTVLGIGFGIGAYMAGYIWPWPFLIAIVGIAFMTKYIPNPWEHI